MYENFVKNLSFLFSSNKEKIKIPFSVKKFLFLAEITFTGKCKEAINYNKTIKLTKLNINEENITDENVVVKHQPHLFLYESELNLNDSIDFSFTWNKLTRKPNTHTNKKLCDYLSKVVGKQLLFILDALSMFSSKEKSDIFTALIKCEQEQHLTGSILSKQDFSTSNCCVKIEIINNLSSLLGIYRLSLKITPITEQNRRTSDAELSHTEN